VAETPEGKIQVCSQMVGRINVYNVLAAVATAIGLGIPNEAIEAGIRNLSAVPGRFERGTPPFELLAGVSASIDWIARLTEATGDRRARLLAALDAIEHHLQALLTRALDGLAGIGGVRMLGAPRRRTSTISFLIDGQHPGEIARRLAGRGICVWNGDNYAYELMHRYGLRDSGGAVRASIVLYNDDDDVDRLLEAVADIARR